MNWNRDEHTTIRSQSVQLVELLVANYISNPRISNNLLVSIVELVNVMSRSTITKMVVTYLKLIVIELNNKYHNPYFNDTMTILNQVEVVESVRDDNKAKQNWEMLESCRQLCELCAI